jgi:DNA repair exonuclease SbcCD ATPase subunit
MEIPKKLREEIWQYCMTNNISNIDEFINKMLVNGFNTEKYGNAPFSYNSEPEVIEKEVIKEVEKIVEKEVIKEVPVEVIKEVEKVVEKRVEVPVEVIKEVPVDRIVEKEVYVTDDETITNLTNKITDLEEKLELEIKTSNAQVEINKELVEVKNSLFDELDEVRNTLKDTISTFDEDRKSFSILNEENEREIKILNKQILDLVEKTKQLEKDLEKKTDDKYKKFWEDEIESHDKTKEEIKQLKETINQLKGNTIKDDDIYGSDEKGWWSGGSNLMGKK